MGSGLLLTVSVVYLWVSVTYYLDERYGMSLAFVAYAAANIGFAWDGWK